ncbi:MAG: hypothetical protein HOU59_gp77 (endogenous virus) [Lactobacillus phage ViSo-2018a]|uniref:Uncharacterized protein n=1 Tax=Lactobacillus phage ViSo-2018a TaxID=2267607 RepID=A0A3G6JHA5_9CAUD|nr:MAG: hypothetical protein HOU59_gp77 [Lactobacillus phage ViSo-2018a]AZA17313.1 MAG: hypothetical protein DQL93_0670 [Lactobacillus phage ViSo-2018a]
MSKAKKYWFPVYSNQGIDPVGYLDIVENKDSEPEYSFEFHLITDRQFEEVGFTRYFLNKVYEALDYEDAEQLKELEQVVDLSD